MTKSRLPLVAFALAACNTDPRGTPVPLDFGDAEVVAAGGAEDGGSGGSSGTESGGTSGGGSATGGSATGGSGGTGGAEPVYGPPIVDQLSPNSGPWGTLVTIRGSDLGSATRDGTQLTLGDALTLAPGDPGIQSWSETRIELRVAFPHEGAIEIETNEGSVSAGTFTPSHEIIAEHPIAQDVGVLASVSLEAGGIALALSSAPISIAQFDGAAWTETPLPDVGLRPETVRLWGNAGKLAAFAANNQSPPELIAFEHDGADWQAQNTGVMLTDRVVMGAGPEGASVWHLAGDGWHRARLTNGTWQLDKGPIADIFPTSKLATSGATSDGALWALRALETGSALDEKGAPFARYLAPDATSFATERQIGDNLDDTLVELDVFERGRGLAVRYCGRDANAIGVGPDDVECRTALLRADQTVTRSAGLEDDTTRHAVATDAQVSATCAPNDGTSVAGTLVAWPCLDVAAVEIDPDAAPVAVFRDGGMLVVLRRR